MNSKLFLMSEPPTNIDFTIRGILTTATHTVLDVVLEQLDHPVKVGKEYNPFHITLKSPPRKAFLSGSLLLKHHQGERVGEYQEVRGIIPMNLQVFNRNGSYVRIENEAIRKEYQQLQEKISGARSKNSKYVNYYYLYMKYKKKFIDLQNSLNEN